MLFESVAAALAAGVAAYAILVLVGPIDVGSTTGSVFFRGFAGGFVGLIVAGLSYAFMGSVEFSELVTTIRTRIPKVSLPFGLGAEVTVASSAEDQA